MPKKFMNTEAEQFLGSVNQIIEKGMIKSKDALISGLVPSNVPDTAVLGQFKVGGIHKYVFQKMNGQNFFEVKCHKIQKDAKGGKACPACEKGAPIVEKKACGGKKAKKRYFGGLV